MFSFQDKIVKLWKSSKYSLLCIIIPMVTIPTLLRVACYNRIFTAMSGCAIIIMLFCLKCLLKKRFSTFLYNWLLISVIILYGIFEFIVIPFNEILREENFILSVLMLISWYSFSWVTTKNSVEFNGDYKMCKLCQMRVPIESNHSVWLDYCISIYNTHPYLIGLATSSAGLLYGSNLTFTTVCHPKILFWSVLIPEDCSNVYDDFNLSLGFVTALYSLKIGLFAFILLISHLIFTIRQCKTTLISNFKQKEISA